MSQPSSPAYQCPDYQFKTSSQGGLGVHRSKKHLAEDSEIKSVSVVRAYPEGKKFHCCLCDNIISSFLNFKRRFVNIHLNTTLNATGFCSICKIAFKNAQAVSIHCKHKHGISKKKASKFPPPDPNSSPILSHVDNNSKAIHTPVNHSICELDQSFVTNDSSLPIGSGSVIQTPTSQMINKCITELLSTHTPPMPPRPIPSTRLSINPPNSSVSADILVGNRFSPPAPRYNQRIYRRNSLPHISACDDLSDLMDF